MHGSPRGQQISQQFPAGRPGFWRARGQHDDQGSEARSPIIGSTEAEPLKNSGAKIDVEPFIHGVQQLMWNKVGIVRSRQSLTEAIQQLQASAQELPPQTSRRNCEARNIHTTALLIARSALARLESRGAHYRTDYPEHEDARFKKHSIVGEKGVRFV